MTTATHHTHGADAGARTPAKGLRASATRRARPDGCGDDFPGSRAYHPGPLGLRLVRNTPCRRLPITLGSGAAYIGDTVLGSLDDRRSHCCAANASLRLQAFN